MALDESSKYHKNAMLISDIQSDIWSDADLKDK